MKWTALLLAIALLAWAPTVWAQEAEVLTVIKAYEKAYNASDLPGMSAIVADDAKMDSRIEKRKMTKAEWAKVIDTQFRAKQILGVEFKDPKVTMTDPTHAMVTVTVVIQIVRRAGSGAGSDSRGATPAFDAEWKFEQRAGIWLLVETTWKN
jgi:hypothetical protein